MTRLLPVLLSVLLASCVTTFRNHRLESIPYSGHGPIFRYEVSPRMIDAGPEVAPIISTLLKHAAASLDALTAPEQPALAPILYRGHEEYQQIGPWSVDGHDVPEGFVSDGASVPRAFWVFMPPDGLHRAAAWWHDWLYQHKGLLPDGFRYTRAEADGALRDVMVGCGVAPWRAAVAYRAVRLFGWVVWDRPKTAPVILPVERRMTMAARIIEPRHFFSHIFAP